MFYKENFQFYKDLLKVERLQLAICKLSANCLRSFDRDPELRFVNRRILTPRSFSWVTVRQDFGLIDLEAG